MLRFLIDHNIPKSVSDFLKKQKYDVLPVKDVNAEMSDAKLVKLAIKENRIILSNDKDFIHLAVKYEKADMILFSFIRQDSAIRINSLKKILPKLKPPFGMLIIE